MFNAGDEVTIRQWDDMVEEFGVKNGKILCDLLCYTEEMKKFCGGKYKISEYDDEDNTFKIEGVNEFWFDTDMIDSWKRGNRR